MQGGIMIGVVCSDCQISMMPIRYLSENDADSTDERLRWMAVPLTVEESTGP